MIRPIGLSKVLGRLLLQRKIGIAFSTEAHCHEEDIQSIELHVLRIPIDINELQNKYYTTIFDWMFLLKFIRNMVFETVKLTNFNCIYFSRVLLHKSNTGTTEK